MSFQDLSFGRHSTGRRSTIMLSSLSCPSSRSFFLSQVLQSVDSEYPHSMREFPNSNTWQKTLCGASKTVSGRRPFKLSFLSVGNQIQRFDSSEGLWVPSLSGKTKVQMRARLKGEKRLKVRLLSGLIKLRRTSQKSISNLQGAKVLVVSDIGEDQCNMRVLILWIWRSATKEFY